MPGKKKSLTPRPMIHFGRNTHTETTSNPIERSPARAQAMRTSGGMTAEIPYRQGMTRRNENDENDEAAHARIKKGVENKMLDQKGLRDKGYMKNQNKQRMKHIEDLQKKDEQLRQENKPPEHETEIQRKLNDLQSLQMNAYKKGRAALMKKMMEEEYHFTTFKRAATYTQDREILNRLQEIDNAFAKRPEEVFEEYDQTITEARKKKENKSWRNILLGRKKAKKPGVNYSKSALVMAATTTEKVQGIGGGVRFHLDGMGETKEDIMAMLRKESVYADTVANDELRFVYRYWSGDKAIKPSLFNGIRSFKYEHGDEKHEVQFHKNNTQFSITINGKATIVPPPWEWKEKETYEEVVKRVRDGRQSAPGVVRSPVEGVT